MDPNLGGSALKHEMSCAGRGSYSNRKRRTARRNVGTA
jgi:hypothetical protein